MAEKEKHIKLIGICRHRQEYSMQRRLREIRRILTQASPLTTSLTNEINNRNMHF
jgi:hypothetical protein